MDIKITFRLENKHFLQHKLNICQFLWNCSSINIPWTQDHIRRTSSALMLVFCHLKSEYEEQTKGIRFDTDINLFNLSC